MVRKASMEDYLGEIYKISEENRFAKEVSSVDIARNLDVSKASVSEMMRKLAKTGLVRCERYSKIRLTLEGSKEASKIIHHHRVIEYFLREVLKCSIKDVHDEAHRLEHAFSDSTIRKLDRFLGNPKISPYGDKIR